MERLTWKGRMDLSRVYTKTSKGILEGNTKSRDLTREHGRVLTLIDGKSSVSNILEKSARLSENRLAAILDELTEMGMIRQLNGALVVDDLGFSSTIIVGESNTQAFFEAQVNLERELRRAEALAAQAKDDERTTLMNEVKADIEAEAQSIKRELAERNTREEQDKAQAGFRRAAEVQSRREADIKAKTEAKARQAREEAEAHAKAVAEHARKQLEAESKARQEAEARANALQAEVFARGEAVRKAKQESAQRGQAEADAKARMEAEKKARVEAEKQALAAEKAREAAEAKAHKATEQAARLAKEIEAKEKTRRALEAKIQAEEDAQHRADMAARLRETEQSKRRAEEEARALAKSVEGARIATELDARVKRRMEARAREEEEARQRVEVEARAKLAEETRLRQEAEARTREEAETRQLAEAIKAKAEQEVQAKLEAERKVETERQAREAAEREALGTAEARAKAEAEAREQAQAEQRRIEAAQAQAVEAARLVAEQQAEAERRARGAAEREAFAAAEARAKAEAEARDQVEAEQRRIEAAQAQAAEAARLVAEQQAEAERQARGAAEREAFAAAEARAKAEAEARDQVEAEQRRIEAAQAQAAEAARLAAEQKLEEERLRTEAQARAVTEAEQAVRMEAEAVKRQLAEQQRAEEARLEREKVARQQEQERSAAEAARGLAEAHARAEAEARSRDDAQKQASERAEATARAEAEEALRHMEDETQREEIEENRMRSEAQSRAMAAAKGAAVFPFLTSRKRTRNRRGTNSNKPLLYGVLGLLVFAIAMLHLVPLNFYIPKLEQQLAESIGQRVVVRELRFSIYPAPHLVLEGVTIGDLADVRIGSTRVFPTFPAWFSQEKVIRRVELASVALSDDSVSALSVWSQHQAQNVPIQFEEIRVKDAQLQNRLLDLFTFDADLFMRQGRMEKTQIRSTDKRITIDITPKNEGLAIQLVATGSVLPFEPRLKFEGLKIAAITQPGSMTLTQIDGQLYGGSVSGNAQIDWRDGWVFKSDLGVRQISIEPALALFTRNITVSGALEAKVRVASKSDMLETLFNAPQVQATFRARDGEIASIDLVRAIQSARSNGNIGGKTHFNELSGYFQLTNGGYQYRQLKLTTGMMSANGNLALSPTHNLSGNVLGELRTRNTVLRTPFTLGGTLVTPTLKAVVPSTRTSPPVQTIKEEQ